MIQASELRLGNWLYASGNTIETYQTSKPKQVTIEFLNAIKVENEERPDAFLTWFSPIPLTPEVLDKCGFVGVKSRVDDSIHKYRKGGIEIFLPEYGFCYYDGDCWTIVKSLHQLQNLYFALTGEELEYKP